MNQPKNLAEARALTAAWNTFLESVELLAPIDEADLTIWMGGGPAPMPDLFTLALACKMAMYNWHLKPDEWFTITTTISRKKVQPTLDGATYGPPVTPETLKDGSRSLQGGYPD